MNAKAPRKHASLWRQIKVVNEGIDPIVFPLDEKGKLKKKIRRQNPRDLTEEIKKYSVDSNMSEILQPGPNIPESELNYQNWYGYASSQPNDKDSIDSNTKILANQEDIYQDFDLFNLTESFDDNGYFNLSEDFNDEQGIYDCLSL